MPSNLPRQSRAPLVGQEAQTRQRFYLAQLRSDNAYLALFYKQECLGKLYRLRRLYGRNVPINQRLTRDEFLRWVRIHMENTSHWIVNHEQHIRQTPPPTYTLSRNRFRSDQELLASARRRRVFLIQASRDSLLRRTLHRFLNDFLEEYGDDQR